MRQLPKELQSIDGTKLRHAIAESVSKAATNWNIDSGEAYEIVIERLKNNRLSRKTLPSAQRYLRDIPEQDYEDY